MIGNGTIAEQGTHDELLEKGGLYKELYETQFRAALEHEKKEGPEDYEFGLTD